MYGSIWNSKQEYIANFDYNQNKYVAQRQFNETLNPQLTRVTVQGVLSKEQQIFNKLLVSPLGRSPRVIDVLTKGAGHGFGRSEPPVQPGTTAILNVTGNQAFMLGSPTTSLDVTQLYTYNLAKSVSLTNGVLPPSYAPAVQSSAAFISISGLATQPTYAVTRRIPAFSVVPGKMEVIDWNTSEQFIYSPNKSSFVGQSTQGLSISPLSSSTSQIAKIFNIKKSKLCAETYLAGSDFLNLFDPLTNQLIEAASDLDKKQRPVDASPKQNQLSSNPNDIAAIRRLALEKRANKFKREVLAELKRQTDLLIKEEEGREAVYPLIYDLAKQAWTEEAIKSVLNLEAVILSSSTYNQIQAAIKQVNRALPYAQRLLDIVNPPSGNPLFKSNGVTINPANLVVKPEYSSTIDYINKFLPTDLRLVLTETTLAFGSVAVATKGVSFVFSNDFKEYVARVNSYLPEDVKWKWGIDDPPKALLIAKGIAVSTSLGLMLNDLAIDLAALIKQSINCSAPANAEIDVNVSNNSIGVNLKSEAVNSSNLINWNFLSQLGDFATVVQNGGLTLDIDKIIDSAQKAFNSIMPPTLQLGLKKTQGAINEIDFGPLKFKNTNNSWGISTPNVHDLKSGVEVVNSLGVLPPTITYLTSASLKIKSLYEDVLEEYRDPSSRLTHDPNLGLGSQGSVWVEYTTGELFTNPIPPIIGNSIPWADEKDPKKSIIGGDLVKHEAYRDLTKRGTTKGMFLALKSIGEKIFNGTANSDTSGLVQLGRSDAGVSLRTGQIPSATGTNYPLLTALCANNGAVVADPEPNPISGDPNTDIISGLEYSLDTPATVPFLSVEDPVDIQSNRDNLEAYLIGIGLGSSASDTLDALDEFLYPIDYSYEEAVIDPDFFEPNVSNVLIEGENLFIRVPVEDTRSLVERDTAPVKKTLSPTVYDLLKVIQAASGLPTQQITGGLLVTVGASDPATEVAKVVRRRISYRLDCDSTSTYEQYLNELVPVSSDFIGSDEFNPLGTLIAPNRDAFQEYTQKYGLDTEFALNYLTNPYKLLDLLDQLEPRLTPPVERLLEGDLFGFWRQLIWSKNNVDLYNSPLEWVRLQTLVSSYYGGAVPSSNPAREWIKQIGTI